MLNRKPWELWGTGELKANLRTGKTRKEKMLYFTELLEQL